MEKSYKELVEEYNIKKEKILNKYVVKGVVPDSVDYDKELKDDIDKYIRKQYIRSIKENTSEMYFQIQNFEIYASFLRNQLV